MASGQSSPRDSARRISAMASSSVPACNSTRAAMSAIAWAGPAIAGEYSDPAREGGEPPRERGYFLECVFGGLDRASLEHLTGRLRLEDRRLLGERVDPLPLLGGRLLDDDELGEARNQERSVLLELFVPDRGQRLEDPLDV